MLDQTVELRPQKGFQEEFAASEADIVIGGGSAGGGKSQILMMESTRHYENPGYKAILFRRTYPQVTGADGIWEKSMNIYPHLGGRSNESNLTWTFSSGAKILFRHLQHEKNIRDYQGHAYAFIGFDELTQFSKKQFFYLLTRNRTTCGVKPYVLATCNPEPESWVRDFISWFIDDETGYPIDERCGLLRYFIIQNDCYVWGNSVDEVVAQCPEYFNQKNLKDKNKKDLVKSMTFIPGSVHDNKILMEKDPSYLGNLISQDKATRAKLLDGNWNISQDGDELVEYDASNDVFNNIPIIKPSDNFYLTCDHARYGKDLCVIITWKGWKAKRLDILPKSNTKDIVKVIDVIRRIYKPLPPSRMIVDQDGINVVDNYGCQIFQGSAAPYKERVKSENVQSKKFTPKYFNKKTQCAYKMAERLNDRDAAIDCNNVWLHETGKNPRKITSYKVSGQTKDIDKIIKQEIRAVKRLHPDGEGKLRITPKSDIVIAIGRSPNFLDNLIMRGDFDYTKERKYLK